MLSPSGTTSSTGRCGQRATSGSWSAARKGRGGWHVTRRAHSADRGGGRWWSWCTVAEALDTAPGYFETSAPGMRYQHFRSHGLFAGSGAVQVGCIRQRLKLSVMH